MRQSRDVRAFPQLEDEVVTPPSQAEARRLLLLFRVDAATAMYIAQENDKFILAPPGFFHCRRRHRNADATMPEYIMIS